MKTKQKYNKEDYRERLVEIIGCYWEKANKNPKENEDEKDTIHDVFVKLYEEEDEKILEKIMGERTEAEKYICKMICLKITDERREGRKMKKYAEDIRKDFSECDRDDEEKDELMNTMEKLEEFVNRNVQMSKREKKLWDLLMDGVGVETIMKKMGYASRHAMQVHLYRLKKKIKEAIDN